VDAVPLIFGTGAFINVAGSGHTLSVTADAGELTISGSDATLRAPGGITLASATGDEINILANLTFNGNTTFNSTTTANEVFLNGRVLMVRAFDGTSDGTIIMNTRRLNFGTNGQI